MIHTNVVRYSSTIRSPFRNPSIKTIGRPLSSTFIFNIRSLSSAIRYVTTNATRSKNKIKSEKLSLPSESSSALLPLWLVRNPQTVAAVPFIGNLAYISIASGFLCTDVLSLRLLLCCGYTGLVTYHALRPKPLLIPLKWSAFFVMCNASMAIMLIAEETPPMLTKKEEKLYLCNFAPLTRKQFKALIDLGKRITYPDGTFLTEANKPCQHLYFITSGTAEMIDVNGKVTSRLQSGGFPNCMSFQRIHWDLSKRKKVAKNRHSYSTIRCKGEVECIVWDDEELLGLLDASAKDDMVSRMNHAVIESVIKRLLYDKGGADVREYIEVISQGWADEEVRELKVQLNFNNNSDDS